MDFESLDVTHRNISVRGFDSGSNYEAHSYYEPAQSTLIQINIRAEMAQSTAEAKTKLQKRINEVKAKQDEVSNQAQTKLQKLEKDTNAKISALNDQIAKANAENKVRIKERLIELRADHDRRVAKLKQAGALIKEALAA